jgi:hypothetical protein
MALEPTALVGQTTVRSLAEAVPALAVEHRVTLRDFGLRDP